MASSRSMRSNPNTHSSRRCVHFAQPLASRCPPPLWLHCLLAPFFSSLCVCARAPVVFVCVVSLVCSAAAVWLAAGLRPAAAVPLSGGPTAAAATTPQSHVSDPTHCTPLSSRSACFLSLSTAVHPPLSPPRDPTVQHAPRPTIRRGRLWLPSPLRGRCGLLYSHDQTTPRHPSLYPASHQSLGLASVFLFLSLSFAHCFLSLVVSSARASTLVPFGPIDSKHNTATTQHAIQVSTQTAGLVDRCARSIRDRQLQLQPS